MSVNSVDIQDIIYQQIREILQKDDFMEEVTLRSETRLVEDLNFASMDFIELVVGIEDDLKQKVGFHDLLMNKGNYVSDLSVSDLVLFIESKLKGTEVKKEENIQESPKFSPLNQIIEKILTPPEIERFRQSVNSKIKEIFQNSFFSDFKKEADLHKNSSAVFLLSPPRCGSTLLRVILAGNNQLFAPPELHLLSYLTLTQRKDALSSDWNQHLLQGTVRALMQLKSSSAEEGRQMMENYETEGLSTKEFYAVLQQELKGQILVDKTPTYASSIEILKQAEDNFDKPLYIHLLRHPYGMIRSYEDAKLDRIVPFMNESSFSRRELAELTWLVNHENIFNFLQDIPEERQFQLKFEDLVTAPQEEIQQLCDFIGIDFQLEMLEAYQDKEQRMTDGLEVASQVSGDLKFYLHRAIDPDVAFRWKKYHTHDFLSDLTWKITEKMGY
jgi:acyl carrier protein